MAFDLDVDSRARELRDAKDHKDLILKSFGSLHGSGIIPRGWDRAGQFLGWGNAKLMSA